MSNLFIKQNSLKNDNSYSYSDSSINAAKILGYSNSKEKYLNKIKPSYIVPPQKHNLNVSKNNNKKFLDSTTSDINNSITSQSNISKINSRTVHFIRECVSGCLKHTKVTFYNISTNFFFGCLF